VNPNNGKKERVFVDLRRVYPTPEEPGTELSFEEIWAAERGWLDTSWEDQAEPDESTEMEEASVAEGNLSSQMEVLCEDVGEKLIIPRDEPDKLAVHQDAKPGKLAIHRDASPRLPVHRDMSEKLVIHQDVIQLDENGKPIYPDSENKIMLDENGAPIYPGGSKPRRKKAVEDNKTLTVKANLDSPSRPKIKKKRNAGVEPTMTMHTRAANEDIYDIFNQPVPKPVQDELTYYGGDYDTDEYTSGGESAETTRNVAASEVGEETEYQDDGEEDDDDGDEIPEEVADETSDVKSVSEWSDFSTRKHVPHAAGEREEGGEEGDEAHDDGEAEDNSQFSNLMDARSNFGTPEPDEEADDQDGDDNEILTPVKESFFPRTRTSFVPIPPEDYVAPTRPYRDPIEAANNRLPFMTPITERTETSVDLHTDDEKENDFHAKTPSRREEKLEVFHEVEENTELLEQLSSPLREVVNEEIRPLRIAQPLGLKPAPLGERKPLGMKAAVAKKGPIVQDAQCNPVDDSVRNEILANIQPPLTSYDGFFDHRTEKHNGGAEIRRHVKAQRGKSSTADKTGHLTTSFPPTVSFPDTETRYTIKRELGAGAFAPVYLVETTVSSDQQEGMDENNMPVMNEGKFALAHKNRRLLEALKMEDPPSAWEFYMMRLAHTRLGPHHRASASLSVALECHLYSNEGFLFLPFHPHGTLLDVVNLFRAEPSGVMDELLAAFFTVELLRTVEALHSKQILHGDLKADNCLLRLDLADNAGLEGPYSPDGSCGWAERGVTLIDFGRGIDMRAFRPDVQFIADWKTGQQDCVEMREGRPWTWQVDYHGLAGIVHCLLFGKYIETVRCDAGGLGVAGGKRYKIRESLKRYWQTEMWSEVFELLLNPGGFVEGEEGGRMPVLKGMRAVRERMEEWLVGSCERGVGLKGLLGKVEGWARGRR
jgi:checkpoint serine/threonine-protein kinase